MRGVAILGGLPFTISVRPWAELQRAETSFFAYSDLLPLHPDHAAQFGLEDYNDAKRLVAWALSTIPRSWPHTGSRHFKHEERLSIAGCWHDEAGHADVTHWLFSRGVPFGRTVYLVYDYDPIVVVQTTWRMVVKFWDSLSWSVGIEMIALDHTLQWACCFHHEEVFIFGSHFAPRPQDGAPTSGSD